VPEQPAAGGEPNMVVAALPPDEAALARSHAAGIVRYVEDYKGGDCFYVAPVAVGDAQATLEGYGDSTGPFEKLDSAFLRANGFEANIGVRLVTKAQCAAVTFLGQLRGEAAHAPQVRIENPLIHPRDLLTGMVYGYGDRHLELLIITDTGVVQNVTHLLKPGTEVMSFEVDMWRTQGSPGGRPHLLIAVVSPQPLASLRAADTPIAAEKFFADVFSEAERTGQPLAAMARYFKMER
jgi:serine/threonine-protein kinase